MKLQDYKKGDRVEVPHGTGEIVGFEAFDKDGNEALMTADPNDTGERALVQLDPGHRWACGHKWPEILYGAWDNHLTKIG